MIGFNPNKINPEISSTREEVLELEPLENSGVFVDKNTGERFHKIRSLPETQKFISLVLKGVMNVADVVEYKGQYFSHEQNISNMDSTAPFSVNEINADRYILSIIFGDKDHRKWSPDSNNPLGTWNTNAYYNINIDKNSDKKYYYDFDDSDMQATSPYDQDYKKEMIQFLEKNATTDEIKIINKKANMVLDTLLCREQFNSFKAIVKKSKILDVYENFRRSVKYTFSPSRNTDDLKIEQLFEDFQDRFSTLLEVSNEKLSKTTQEKDID